MNKMMTKISAAALSAAMVLGNGIVLSAYADDAETTTAAVETTTAAATESQTEATTTATETTTAAPATTTAAQPSVAVSALAGTWQYQVSSGNYTVEQGAKSNGTVTINSDGTFSYTDATGKVTTGTVKAEVENIGGTNITNINFYAGSTFSFGGAYRNADEISIGNGGMSRLVRGAAVIAETTTAAATSAVATSATGSATSAASTTAAATTTKANKNDSPKTGDSFPALAMTAALLSAAALSITTKKRNK